MIATPVVATTESDLATEAEAFLELVRGDPDLLEAEFSAITAGCSPGQQPPGKTWGVSAHDSGEQVVLRSISGARPNARAGERSTRRRNRQRSPPSPTTDLARQR